MRSILALDLSKSGTGFAFGRPDQVPVTGLVTFRGASNAEVWRNVAVWISGQFKVMLPDELAIELKISSSGHSGFATNAQTQDLLAGIQVIVRTFWFTHAGREPDLVPSSTARKCFIGKGGNFDGDPKELVKAEAIRRGWLDLETVQGDKADALAVWCCKAAEQIPELAFNPPKRRKAPAAVVPGVF